MANKGRRKRTVSVNRCRDRRPSRESRPKGHTGTAVVAKRQEGPRVRSRNFNRDSSSEAMADLCVPENLERRCSHGEPAPAQGASTGRPWTGRGGRTLVAAASHGHGGCSRWTGHRGRPATVGPSATRKGRPGERSASGRLGERGARACSGGIKYLHSFINKFYFLKNILYFLLFSLKNSIFYSIVLRGSLYSTIHYFMLYLITTFYFYYLI
jgi:hypothetical protein